MTDSPWTLDPAIEEFMKTLELPPEPFMENLAAERVPREAAAPDVGQIAPEFVAAVLPADGRPAGEFTRLSDYRGRHLALIFGSFTCPIYRGQTGRFNEVYAELHDQLSFLLIYTREAHPQDGWQVDVNHTQNVIYDQPTTIAERAAIARDCVMQRDIRMRVALDDIDDSIDKNYAGWPERLYLIDADGVVRHRSGPGPFQMDAIEAWYSALRDL